MDSIINELNMQNQIKIILKDIDTTLAEKDDEFLERWISYCLPEVNHEIFPHKENDINYQQCVAYLTASKIQNALTASKHSTNQGEVKTVQGGSSKVEYHQNTQQNDNMYLVEYKRILKKYTKTSFILEVS